MYRIIDPVSRTQKYTRLRNAFPDRLRVSEVATSQSPYPAVNRAFCFCVRKAVAPLLEREST